MAGIGDYISGGWQLVKSKPAEMIGGLIVVGIVSAFSAFICTSMMTTGYFAMIAKARRGEPISFGDLFSRFDADAFMTGLPALLTGLASNGLTIAGMPTQPGQMPGGLYQLGMLFGLVNLVVTIVFLWGPYIQGAKRVPWMDALKGSIDFWMKDPIGNLIVVVVASIVGGLGAIACCVGLFVTAPLSSAAVMIAYLDKSGVQPYTPAAQ